MIYEKGLLKASTPHVEEVLLKYVQFQSHFSYNSERCLPYHASQEHVPLRTGFVKSFSIE